MTYALSLLDKSPILKGETATDALRRTVALAQLAERLGYRRFWVAEHHDTPDLASSSPEVLIPFLLANTNTIRVGSGGVMLQHYSAYKVAENFNVLAALAPGRVDIGIGKAPGGLPFSTRALKGARDGGQKFDEQLADLTAWLDAAAASVEARATPSPVVGADRFLLGASVDSAELAAARGWDFVFARHLNGDNALLEAVVAAYRKATGRPPLVAIAAIIGESVEDAAAQADKVRFFKVHIANAQSVTVGSQEQAAEYARQAGATEYRVEPKTSSVISGSARQVREELDRLHEQHGIEEFIIDPFSAGDQRLVAIELLAAELQVVRRAAPVWTQELRA